jgi:spore maturation protein CgeB
VCDTELEEAVLELGAAVSVFLDVDPAATLAAPSERFRSLVPEFDVVLTHGGGQPVCDRYRALGARDCVPVYNAVDPATHYPVPPSERYASDLTLIADRQEWVEELLFEAAVQLPEHDFLLGGAGWADTPLPGNVQRLGHVASADHNLLNSSALAVLVVTRPDLAQLGWSPPTRLFEAAGAAACLITDDWPGIEDFLEPEVEVLVARGAAEVVQHLLELTPERARAIGSAARERVLAQHTYAHRAELVESALASVHAGRAL